MCRTHMRAEDAVDAVELDVERAHVVVLSERIEYLETRRGPHRAKTDSWFGGICS